jgi:hypothetical protein
MSAMPEAEAREILKQHEDTIRECIQSGWNKYMQYDPLLRADHTPRTRANIVRDHIVSEVRKKFGTNGTRLHEQSDGLFCLNVGDKILIKFKKFDEEKNSSSIPTQQAMDFIMQYDLPGYRSVTNLIAGYDLNPSQTSINAISIACPNGSSNHWCYDLQLPMAEVIPMPMDDLNLDDLDKGKQKERVKLKNPAEEKERKEGNE